MLSICVQVLASQDTNSSTPALLTEMEMRSSASSYLCLTSRRGPCCAGGCRGADVRGHRAASSSRHFSCFHLSLPLCGCCFVPAWNSPPPFSFFLYSVPPVRLMIRHRHGQSGAAALHGRGSHLRAQPSPLPVLLPHPSLPFQSGDKSHMKDLPVRRCWEFKDKLHSEVTGGGPSPREQGVPRLLWYCVQMVWSLQSVCLCVCVCTWFRTCTL